MSLAAIGAFGSQIRTRTPPEPGSIQRIDVLTPRGILRHPPRAIRWLCTDVAAVVWRIWIVDESGMLIVDRRVMDSLARSAVLNEQECFLLEDPGSFMLRITGAGADGELVSASPRQSFEVLTPDGP